MEQTYMSWAMVLIGLGAVAAGTVGLFLPQGHRLTVLLTLVIGAGVGVAALFLQVLGGGFDEPERAASSFLIASLLGLVAVVAGLGVLLRRARAT
ncbi:MAG: hypothetical protein ACXWZF_02775 [Actinomycetota bacterium]